MKKIHLSELKAKIDSFYVKVPQPMFICHSTDELNLLYTGRTKNGVKVNPLVISDIMKLQSYLIHTGRNEGNKQYDMTKEDVWIDTKENIIPDVQDANGNITPLYVDGAIKYTDTCYIQMFGFIKVYNKIHAYTSSGIHGFSIDQWCPTAAVRSQFNSSALTGYEAKKNYTEDMRERKKKKFLEGKRTTIQDVRFVHYMLNPMNPKLFMNAGAAIREAYKDLHWISTEDKIKMITSERVTKLFLKELALMNPTLKEQMDADVPPSYITDFLKKIAEKSLKDGSVDDALKVFREILVTGEHMDTVTSEISLPMLDSRKSPPKRIQLYDGDDTPSLTHEPSYEEKNYQIQE